MTQRSKLLVLNSPNNPSGAVYTKEELEALGKVIRKHGLYVLSTRSTSSWCSGTPGT